MTKCKLLPTIGFDKVRFGMKAAQVKAILGKPDEEYDEQLGDSPDDLSHLLIYGDLGLSLSFDKSEDFRLVDIMTEDGCQLTLGDDIRLGDSFEEVFRKVQKADYGPIEECEIDDELDDDEEEEAKGLAEYELPDVSVNLWFKYGKLDTIQLGPEYGDDDSIIWPED